MSDLFKYADEHYPKVPGYRQTDTSKAAAQGMSDATPDLQARVLACLRHFKHLTTDECAAYLDVDRYSVRPRFSELREQGLIEDSGDRRSNDSRRKAIVWRLVSKH